MHKWDQRGQTVRQRRWKNRLVMPGTDINTLSWMDIRDLATGLYCPPSISALHLTTGPAWRGDILLRNRYDLHRGNWPRIGAGPFWDRRYNLVEPCAWHRRVVGMVTYVCSACWGAPVSDEAKLDMEFEKRIARASLILVGCASVFGRLALWLSRWNVRFTEQQYSMEWTLYWNKLGSGMPYTW